MFGQQHGMSGSARELPCADLLPNKYLALTGHGGIACKSLVCAFMVFERHDNPDRAQVPGVETNESRTVIAAVRKRWQKRDWFERENRSADHPGAGADFGAAHENDRAALHLEAGEIADRAADGNDAPAHAHSDFESCRAVNQDRSVSHSLGAAA